MEELFGGIIFNLIKKFKWPLLIFWFVFVTIFGVIAATGLKRATKAAELGSQSYDLVRFVTLSQNYWKQDSEQQVFVAWGLDPSNPVTKYISENPMKLELNWNANNAMAITTPKGQQKVLDLCRASDVAGVRCEYETCLVRGSPKVCEQEEKSVKVCERRTPLCTTKTIPITNSRCLSGGYCFMELVAEYAKYWAEPTLEFPVPDLVAVLKSESFKDYVREKTNLMYKHGLSWEPYNIEKATGWVIQGDTLKFAWIGFNATFGMRPAVSVTNDFHKRWDDHVAKYAPGTGGAKTSEVFNFMVTQNELVRAAVQGILTSLFVAFVVLFAVTWNILIALIGLLNITAVTVVFLGLIPIIGWELGTSECIFLIAVVGLSVDYTVHMLHSYNEHEGETREDKLQNALQTMGISVLSGAITTLLAALPLYLCIIRFFSQYGQFIFFVCLFAFLLAIALLSPLLLVLGPQGNQGDIRVLLRRFKGEQAKPIIRDKE